MKLPNTTILLALALAAAPAGAAELAGLARQLGSRAKAAGLRRVAVSRLEPARGADDGRGEALADALTGALVRDGRVQPVERDLLKRLSEEIALDRTGAVEGASERQMRLLPVDALVVGRWARVGLKIRVFARVVDARTGAIAAAAVADLDDDEALAADPFAVNVPSLAGAFPSMDGESLRDAPADPAAETSCAGAAERVRGLQEDVIDLKARFWARTLDMDAGTSQAADSPDATIPDPGQRGRFHARLRAWQAAPAVPPLGSGDVERIARAEGRSRELMRVCGL